MSLFVGISMGQNILMFLVFILVLATLLGYTISIHNGLVRLKNDIDKAWANIDAERAP